MPELVIFAIFVGIFVRLKITTSPRNVSLAVTDMQLMFQTLVFTLLRLSFWINSIAREVKSAAELPKQIPT